MIPERDLLRDGRRDIGRRRRQPRGQRLGRCRPLARQRGVDKAVLDREVPLDRQFLRRDQFDHLGDFSAECGGDAGCHLRVVGGVREEQADRAEGQRQTNLKPHALRNDAFLLQLAENGMRADRVFRVAEPPAGIAEPHLCDARLDAELELVVHAQRPPALDAVRIGAGRRSVSISAWPLKTR